LMGIEGFVDWLRDFREDTKKLIELFEGVDVAEMVTEIKRLNDNLERANPTVMLSQIRQLNDILEQIDMEALSKISDTIDELDIDEFQQNIKFLMKLGEQLSEGE